jgi:hypothetical protein
MAFRGSRMLAYFGRMLQIVAILIIPATLLLIAGGIVAASLLQIGGHFAGMLALLLIVILPIGVLFYRMSPVLPAAAVGKPLGIGAAMTATSGSSGAIAVMMVIAAVTISVIESAMMALFPLGSTIGFVVDAVLQWLLALFGVSILTTIYGHYVEGRPLV